MLSVVGVLLAASASAPARAGEWDGIEQETAQVDCRVEDIARRIRQQQPVVPSRIYHYGKKANLLADAAADRIPGDAWNRFIMGNGGRFSLYPSRRGLYGTAGIDTNGFGDDDHNWLIEIRLKKECREPEHVATFASLSDDPRFQKWFQDRVGKEEMTLDRFGRECTLLGYLGWSSAKCEKIVVRYLEENRIWIVQDTIIRKSFYIRNPECVETIVGDADEWLRLLPTSPHLWRTYCGSMQEHYLFGLVLQVMLDSSTDGITPEVKQAWINRLTSNQEVFGRRLANAIIALVLAKERCALKGQSGDFSRLLRKGFPTDKLLAADKEAPDASYFEGFCR